MPPRLCRCAVMVSVMDDLLVGGRWRRIWPHFGFELRVRACFGRVDTHRPSKPSRKNHGEPFVKPRRLDCVHFVRSAGLAGSMIRRLMRERRMQRRKTHKTRAVSDVTGDESGLIDVELIDLIA